MKDIVPVEASEEATLHYSIKGYHIYYATQSAAMGSCIWSSVQKSWPVSVGNYYAVAVKRCGTTIGYLPWRISCVNYTRICFCKEYALLQSYNLDDILPKYI